MSKQPPVATRVPPPARSWRARPATSCPRAGVQAAGRAVHRPVRRRTGGPGDRRRPPRPTRRRPPGHRLGRQFAMARGRPRRTLRTGRPRRTDRRPGDGAAGRERTSSPATARNAPARPGRHATARTGHRPASSSATRSGAGRPRGGVAGAARQGAARLGQVGCHQRAPGDRRGAARVRVPHDRGTSGGRGASPIAGGCRG